MLEIVLLFFAALGFFLGIAVLVGIAAAALLGLAVQYGIRAVSRAEAQAHPMSHPDQVRWTDSASTLGPVVGKGEETPVADPELAVLGPLRIVQGASNDPGRPSDTPPPPKKRPCAFCAKIRKAFRRP